MDYYQEVGSDGLLLYRRDGGKWHWDGSKGIGEVQLNLMLLLMKHCCCSLTSLMD
jgi:hypothetical protein